MMEEMRRRGNVDWRLEGLRAVLFGYGVGHLATTTLFLGWPRYFLTGEGSAPPWPLSIFQFGFWPPTHVGFMNVLAVYDLAVATALFIAAWDPKRHTGILAFLTVLFLGHGGMHAYHILWGTSPTVYWWTTVELWAGVALIWGLYPRTRKTKEPTPQPPAPEGAGAP